MKPVVFFDIDNTLIKGNTQVAMLSSLFKRGLISPFFLLSNAFWFIGYKFGINAKFEETVKHTRKAYKIIEGWEEQKFLDILDDIFQKDIKPKVFKQALEIIKEHNKNGFETVLLSGTIDPLAEVIGKGLGIKICLANRLLTRDGKYTGDIENNFVYGQGKVDLIQKMAPKYEWDLKNSFAYTDHISDIPLLSLVLNPRVVNPDKKLKEEAKKRSWPILVWTKRK